MNEIINESIDVMKMDGLCKRMGSTYEEIINLDTRDVMKKRKALIYVLHKDYNLCAEDLITVLRRYQSSQYFMRYTVIENINHDMDVMENISKLRSPSEERIARINYWVIPGLIKKQE